jgi:hypothetical protein
LALVTPDFLPGERVVAMLPFASTTKRPKTAGGKVRVGVWQTSRRYRPLVLTNQRLFVFETYRTPNPRGVLCEFPSASVSVARSSPGSMGTTTLVLELPTDGEVPFELGRFDVAELEGFRNALDSGANS